MALSDRLQRFVMRTSPYQPFRWIYAIVYGAMLGWLMIQVRREPQIKRLEWRTPSPGHRYGISDLDVRAETARLNTEQYFRLCARLSGFLRPRSHWRRILDFMFSGRTNGSCNDAWGRPHSAVPEWSGFLVPKEARSSQLPIRQLQMRCCAELCTNTRTCWSCCSRKP